MKGGSTHNRYEEESWWCGYEEDGHNALPYPLAIGVLETQNMIWKYDSSYAQFFLTHVMYDDRHKEPNLGLQLCPLAIPTTFEDIIHSWGFVSVIVSS
jgi:hypothetical protein